MAVQISGNDITVPRDGSFTRNVTIGGTLTYEDVTNIDSVGLVTARTGIEIGARPGVAASISVDGNMIVSGISTFGGDVQVPDKIIHAGDTNTAIRFPAADTFAVETGGSERARVSSDGNLGIGTVTPSGLLHTHAASGTNRNYIEASAGNAFLRIKSGSTSNNSGLEFNSGSSNTANVTGLGAGGLQFEVGGSERFRFGSSGQFGIGGATYGTSGQVLTSGGASAAPTWAAAGGISMIDSWRMTTSTSNGTNATVENWAAATNKLNSSLGTALGYSSGIFSFPSTGHYLLTFGCRFHCGSGNDGTMSVFLQVTENNSSYSDAALTSYGAQEGDTKATGSITYAFDITDTSNQKFKFITDSFGSSSQIMGVSTENQTYFQIIRLADT